MAAALTAFVQVDRQVFLRRVPPRVEAQEDGRLVDLHELGGGKKERMLSA